MRHPDPSTFALYLLALDALGLKATAAKLAESNDADQLVLAVVTIRAAVATAAPSGPRSTEIMRKILVVLEALAADLLHLSPPATAPRARPARSGAGVRPWRHTAIGRRTCRRCSTTDDRQTIAPPPPRSPNDRPLAPLEVPRARPIPRPRGRP